MPKVRDFDFGQICFESDSMQVLSMSHKGRDDSEFPVTQGPINLSVLKSDGLLSHRWGVKTNHKGDAYVYCRDVPRAEKVSLHASGRQHISFTSQTSAHLGADCRFGNVWKEPDFESDAIATFSLVFPPWSAGLRPEERRTLTKDELVIVGHREKLVVVSFFIVDSAKKMREEDAGPLASFCAWSTTAQTRKDPAHQLAQSGGSRRMSTRRPFR